ncbi:MAG: A circularly permuted ATPgrasp family protein [Burkholderiales bacterium PBB3]|nr:MAG: A circularly permuted ATPgrasp family protein [Burkholderiales bacterium PBB3]
MAKALASPQAALGHFDELRGRTSTGAAPNPLAANLIADYAGMTGPWREFFASLETDGQGSLGQRAASLARQIRDNGVTYNVYADEGGPQRPWSLDLFPLIISAQSWSQIEVGVQQRMRLLEGVMADVYGEQQLLSHGLLPPALVHGHPGYLRPMHGVKPVGGVHLHIAAFDMARGPDGNWWVVSQRTQAPSGLGYLLENRLAVSRLFPQAFESLQVQRLAGTYRALMDSMKRSSPAGQDAHIALLTPGPYNETYFEHAYLARYLGVTLVEGSDLTVRDQHLYLKTLRGLVPVHGLLKRLDDQFLDPLELRADSALGVPGLLQAIRAGHVMVANAPGSAFLESPALLGFLPALCRHLLGEDLKLPALPTWWCGERSAMEEVLPQLQDCAIKPTYPGSAHHGNFDAVLCRNLSDSALDEWAGRIVRQSEDHTIQAYLPLSQMPTWQPPEAVASADAPVGRGKISPKSVILRVFAVSDGAQSWRVLPGGLARVAGASANIASMQHGGSSADVWVMTQGSVDTTTLLRPPLTASALAQRKRLVTSRAAENLFWLGRYTERAENSVRLARLTLECLHGEDQNCAPLMDWLGRMAVANTLVLPGVPSPAQARRVFERSLISSLGGTDQATSVGYNLRAMRLAGSSVRERLSQEHWNVMQRAEQSFADRCAHTVAQGDYSWLESLDTLRAISDRLAAITGAQTDRMTRDDGWRLLSLGRHIERLRFLSTALLLGFDSESVHEDGGFEAMISLFDSEITFHAQYQQSHDLAALLDLLVLDRDNPRALAWVAHTLRGRLARLAGAAPDQLSLMSANVPNPGLWQLEPLCEPGSDAQFANLRQLLLDCGQAANNVSEDISTTYFTHAQATGQSLGA